MSEILAAILGALLAGGLQTIIGVCDRKREAESVLVAMASEVDSICRLIRHRGYLDGVLEITDQIKNNIWDGRTLIVDVRSDYFSVFNALSPRIGLLKPGHASLIVNFYAYCKSTIDSLRPDGPLADADDKESIAGNILELEPILRAILSLGDQIVQLPQHPLHSDSR